VCPTQFYIHIRIPLCFYTHLCLFLKGLGREVVKAELSAALKTLSSRAFPHHVFLLTPPLPLSSPFIRHTLRARAIVPRRGLLPAGLDGKPSRHNGDAPWFSPVTGQGRRLHFFTLSLRSPHVVCLPHGDCRLQRPR
jgi:hypothetical protein